jgi:hypothetical protein
MAKRDSLILRLAGFVVFAASSTVACWSSMFSLIVVHAVVLGAPVVAANQHLDSGGGGVSGSSEQVLLLSEAGSGAHAFASQLAAEAKALRGDEFLITWDPCAVARRRRAALAITEQGGVNNLLAFGAKQCSELVQVRKTYTFVSIMHVREPLCEE